MIFLPPVNRLVIAQVNKNLTKHVGPSKEWQDTGCGLKSRTDVLNDTPNVDSGCVDAVILKGSTRERFWIWIPFVPLGVDTHTHFKQGQRCMPTEWLWWGVGHWPLQSCTYLNRVNVLKAVFTHALYIWTFPDITSERFQRKVHRRTQVSYAVGLDIVRDGKLKTVLSPTAPIHGDVRIIQEMDWLNSQLWSPFALTQPSSISCIKSTCKLDICYCELLWDFSVMEWFL